MDDLIICGKDYDKYKIEDIRNKIINGDVLKELKKIPDESIDCIVSSPPYWGLRDYGVDGQIGLEETLKVFIDKMLTITAELKRMLKKTGVMYWNHGDNYSTGNAGSNWNNVSEDYLKNHKITGNARMGEWHIKYVKPVPQKCMCMQNYRLIIKMIDEQEWILRNTIIWHKPNGMPSSVRDRFGNSHEPVFMLVKNQKYWFDLDAVRIKTGKEVDWREYEKYRKQKQNITLERGTRDWKRIDGNHPLGKNPGDVWTIPTQPMTEAHFATFPEKLINPMILLGCPKDICKKCGKARERITETEYKTTGSQKGIKQRTSGYQVNRPYEERKEVTHQTIGWTDCECNTGWENGIVLDPFMGSGTTAIVATKLGRDFVGIELNPEYVEIIKKRLSKVSLSLF